MAKDLLGKEDIRGRDAARRETEERDGVPIRPISESSLNRMMRQREEISNQVVGAVKEIEQLRMRQRLLEKEKTDLENLARRQEEYTAAKRDIVEKLGRSIRRMEKEEQDATRMLELIRVLRDRFKQSLTDLGDIDESRWSERDFETELTRAALLVRDAGEVYLKGIAKLEAENWHRVATGEKPPDIAAAVMPELRGEKGFGYWVKAGFAIGLPIVLFMAVLLLAWALLARSL